MPEGDYQLSTYEQGTLFDFRCLEVELRTEGEFDMADCVREYADACESGDYLRERLTMRRVREVTARTGASQ